MFGRTDRACNLPVDCSTDFGSSLFLIGAVFTEADEREQARRAGKADVAPAAAAVAATEQPVVLAPAAVATLPPPIRPSKPAMYL